MSDISFNTMIPQDDQNRLIAIRDAMSRSYWEIGDIANRDVNLAVDNAIPVTTGQVFAAVGYYVGASARTVRYYADVAHFYPGGECWKCGATLVQEGDQMICHFCEEPSHSWREHFEELSFSHYAHAIQFRENDEWKRVLERAATGHPYSGIMSVDAMMHEVQGAPANPAPEFDANFDVPGLDGFEVQPPPAGLEPFYALANAVRQVQGAVKLSQEDQLELDELLTRIGKLVQKYFQKLTTRS